MLYHNQKSISGRQRVERGFVFEIWSIPRLILVIPDSSNTIGFHMANLSLYLLSSMEKKSDFHKSQQLRYHMVQN